MCPVVLSLLPVSPPLIQRWAKIAQTLERKQVGAQRNDNVIGGDQGRAIDSAQVGPDIGQNNIGVHLPCPGLHDGRERGQNTEGAEQLARVGTQCIGPFRRQGVFKSGQRQIAGYQVQRRGDFREIRVFDVSHSRQRLNALQNGLRGCIAFVVPQRFQMILIQKCSGEVRLRIKVTGQHLVAHVGQHPRDVVDQRGFADASLVVEEGQNGNAHRSAASRFCLAFTAADLKILPRLTAASGIAGDTVTSLLPNKLLPDLPHPPFPKSGYGLAAGGVRDRRRRKSMLSDVIRQPGNGLPP